MLQDIQGHIKQYLTIYYEQYIEIFGELEFLEGVMLNLNFVMLHFNKWPPSMVNEILRKKNNHQKRYNIYGSYSEVFLPDLREELIHF